jgi:hypothetical protein
MPHLASLSTSRLAAKADQTTGLPQHPPPSAADQLSRLEDVQQAARERLNLLSPVHRLPMLHLLMLGCIYKVYCQQQSSMCSAGPSLLARRAAVVGNSTLDFNYYGPVEEYATYVKSRPACYIDENNPGTTCFDALMSVSNRFPRCRLTAKSQMYSETPAIMYSANAAM